MLSDIEKFLKDHNSSAAALAVAYDLVGDVKILRQAIKLYPHAPELLWRLSCASNDPTERIGAADSYIDSHPKASLGYYLKTSALIANNRFDEAQKALLLGLQGSPPQTTDSADVLLRRQAWESMGKSSIDARICGFFGKSDDDCSRALTSPLHWIDKVTAPGGNGQLAELGASYAEHFRLKQGIQASDEFNALVFQGKLMDRMDPELEWGETGMTIREKKATLQTATNDFIDLTHQAALITGNLPAQQLANYFDAALAYGEYAAMKQLISGRQ